MFPSLFYSLISLKMNHKILLGLILLTLAATLKIKIHENTGHNILGGWTKIDLKNMTAE